MTENANIPTFKLVLVGDGGTGKVRNLSHICFFLFFSLSRTNRVGIDDLCQETSYG